MTQRLAGLHVRFACISRRFFLDRRCPRRPYALGTSQGNFVRGKIRGRESIKRLPTPYPVLDPLSRPRPLIPSSTPYPVLDPLSRPRPLIPSSTPYPLPPSNPPRPLIPSPPPYFVPTPYPVRPLIPSSTPYPVLDPLSRPQSWLPPPAPCSAGRGPAIKDVDIQFRSDDRDRGRDETRTPARAIDP